MALPFSGRVRDNVSTVQIKVNRGREMVSEIVTRHPTNPKRTCKSSKGENIFFVSLHLEEDESGIKNAGF